MHLSTFRLDKKRLVLLIAVLILVAISFNIYTVSEANRLARRVSRESINPIAYIKSWHLEPFEWCPQIPTDIDCDPIFEGAHEAIKQAMHWRPPCSQTDAHMVELTQDCEKLKTDFRFVRSPLSEEERDFPLAFVILVARNAAQVVRLLSAIYQPQNAYCLTYDLHSKGYFSKAMDSLIECFGENIWTPPVKREISWGDFSILESTVDCLRILSDRRKRIDWQYVQILSWNDIPLKTNLEMVRILKLFDGASDAELTRARTEVFAEYFKDGDEDKKMRGKRKPVPPDGLVVYKGSFAVTLHADFVRFILTDETAREFYEWSRSSWVAEELFWSTLIHNNHLGQNGSYPGSCLAYYKYEHRRKRFISRYQAWFGEQRCAGRFRSGSCIFGLGDLQRLIAKPHLVAHKFYDDYQPAASYCMHRRLFERSRRGIVQLNMTYYENLPAVKYRRLKNKNEFSC